MKEIGNNKEGNKFIKKSADKGYSKKHNNNVKKWCWNRS